MVQITNGTIGYSRVRKDDDFGINRKAEASLSWSVEDGDSPPQIKLHIEQIEQAVFDIAHRLLTKQFTAARTAEQKAEPDAGPKVGEAVPPPAKPVAPSGSAPSDKEKLAAEAGVGAKAREALEKKTAEQFGQGPKPPRAPRKAKDAPVAEAPATAAAVEDDDPLGLGIIVPEEKLEPVTDAELGSATVAKNKVLQKPDAIRALIAEFAGPPPKQARDIPQEKRHAYLAKLKTLS